MHNVYRAVVFCFLLFCSLDLRAQATLVPTLITFDGIAIIPPFNQAPVFPEAGMSSIVGNLGNEGSPYNGFPFLICGSLCAGRGGIVYNVISMQFYNQSRAPSGVMQVEFDYINYVQGNGGAPSPYYIRVTYASGQGTNLGANRSKPVERVIIQAPPGDPIVDLKLTDPFAFVNPNFAIDNLVIWRAPVTNNLNLSVVQNATAFTGSPSQATAVANKFSVKPSVTTNIYVNVTGSGFNTPETRTASVSLKIGNNPLMTVPVSVASIQSAPGGVLPVSFSYTPTVAEAGEVSLSASIAVSGDTNSSDDSFQSSMYVLCNVEDTKGGRTVKFWSQAELRPGSSTSWKNDMFGNIANSTSPGTMQYYGCSVTDFAMLMDYYGVKKTPRGSPINPILPGILSLPGLSGENLDPGYLNAAFTNYLVRPALVSPLRSGSVALNSMNNPDWMGMAQVARAAYADQCASPSPLSCDPTKKSTIISFVSYVQSFNNSNASQDHKNIEYDLCKGNPVILRFIKPNPINPANPGQHFMLATGMDVDANGNKIYRINNPGTSNGEGKPQTNFLSKYPSITGYIRYSSSADPSMMTITAPMNVHFIVTDLMGRRSGYDPNTNTTYNEIPGASYSNQSIDTPSDEGLPNKTLVAERYFTYSSTSDIPIGSYSVQIYAVNSGSYYLEYRGYDSNGNLNSNEIRNGVLNAGGSATQLLNHSNVAAPVINADLKIEHFMMRKKPKNSFARSHLKIEGQLRRRDNKPTSISNSVNISIGGSSGYKLNLFGTDFKLRKSSEKSYYLYSKGGIEIKISTLGNFDIDIENADLRDVDRLHLGEFELQIDDAFGAGSIQLECKKNACKIRGKGSFIKDDEE